MKNEVAAHFSKIGSTHAVPELRAYACNVASEEQVKTTWAQIIQDFGDRIDVLVTAAGIVENFDVQEYPLDGFKRVMDVRYLLTHLILLHVDGL